jgi:two-component system response regulator
MTEPPVEVLLVQRDPNGVRQTLDVLQKHHLASRIHIVRDTSEALEFLFCSGAYAGREPHNPRLVIVDADLAMANGLDMLRLIRGDQRTSRVFVTAVACCENTRLAAMDVFRAHDFEIPVVMIGAWVPGEEEPESADIGPHDDAARHRPAPGGSGDARPRHARRHAGSAPAVNVEQLCSERDFESLARAARDMAHEFNNLFAVITAYTELLLRDVDIDDPRRDGADEIFKSIAYASGLTHRLMALSSDDLADDDATARGSRPAGLPTG